MQFSEYQEAIFDHVANSDKNAIVIARAGSGKTTTIIESLRHRPRGTPTLLCAFNKRIQQELQARVEQKGLSSVGVKTLHAIGLQALKSKNCFLEVDEDKTKVAAKKLLTEEGISRALFWPRIKMLQKLVSLGKNLQLAGNHERLLDLALAFGIGDKDHYPDELAVQASRLMEQAALNDSIVDFDDMLWLPWIREVKLPTRKLVFVDEAQDLNPIQQWMCTEMVGERLIAVGDDKQAIYGWRGATPNILSELQRTFDAEVYKLPVTYRCAKTITKLTQKTVPDLQCPPDAAEGKVSSCNSVDMLEYVTPGDFILSRLNAPLVGFCVRLLAKGVPATIAGRDIGKTLISWVKKSQTITSADLIRWLKEEMRQQAERLLPEYEDRYETVVDICTALETLAKQVATSGEVVQKLDRLFSDDDPSTKVVLSSIHKAKGLERDRVWLLKDTFYKKSQEEKNIWYVGVTRTKNELWLVTDKEA